MCASASRAHSNAFNLGAPLWLSIDGAAPEGAMRALPPPLSPEAAEAARAGACAAALAAGFSPKVAEHLSRSVDERTAALAATVDRSIVRWVLIFGALIGSCHAACFLCHLRC